MGRLLTATVKNAEGATLDTTANTYTKAGYKHTEVGGGVTVTYAYDAIGRMTTASETGGVVKTYAYDLAGNRTGFVLKQGSTTLQNMAYTYSGRGIMTRWWVGLRKVIRQGMG